MVLDKSSFEDYDEFLLGDTVRPGDEEYDNDAHTDDEPTVGATLVGLSYTTQPRATSHKPLIHHHSNLIITIFLDEEPEVVVATEPVRNHQ